MARRSPAAAVTARMPLDGRGWGRLDHSRRLLFRATASSVSRRLPPPAAGLILAAARAGWLPFALSGASRFARRRHVPAWPLFLDCLMSGAKPGEAFLWRELFDERIELGQRAVSLLLGTLGEPAGRKLLADKVATAEALQAVGVQVPDTLAVLRRDSADADFGPVRDAGVALVIKPRGGSSALGLVMAEPLGGDLWRVNGDVMRWDAFSAALRDAGVTWLAQPRLRGAAALAGFLDADRPPVLRVTTARRPGGAPFVHSALLAIPVPGAAAPDFTSKDVRAPVDLASGRLEAGRLFAKPHETLAAAPWNGAPIAGRTLDGVDAAVQATLAAAAAVPPLPIISWDVVLTDAGPVILEGNSVANWLLPRYARASGAGEGGSLLPLLAEWASASRQAAPLNAGLRRSRASQRR